MVVRPEKLPSTFRDEDRTSQTGTTPAIHSEGHQGMHHAGFTPLPIPLGKALLDQTIAELPERETSAEARACANQEADETRSVSDWKTSQVYQSSSFPSSVNEERSDSRSSRNSVRRDRSNTWSHSSLSVRAARRSGSLPAMECGMTHVPKLDLSRGDSPFPSTPTCVSPYKSNRLLTCSDNRMSCSPRLPPIGCLSDFHHVRLLPKNIPRELTREVTNIDPSLVDNADTTDVRLLGRRRNALMTPQPAIPDNGS